jgi:RNA polymerase sigma factor (sigma-70 family)
VMQRDLVERARAGDVEAFTALVEDRVERMFRTAMAILGTEADARDAAQDALSLIWQRLPQLHDPDRFEAWSGRVLVNACRMIDRHRRSRVREISVASLALDPSAKSAQPVADSSAERIARLDLLERAFNRLTLDERTMLALHHLEERSLRELSAVLGIPEGTVKSRLHAARRSLERAMERESQ